MFASRSSTRASSAEEERPCASGALRGSVTVSCSIIMEDGSRTSRGPPVVVLFLTLVGDGIGAYVPSGTVGLRAMPGVVGKEGRVAGRHGQQHLLREVDLRKGDTPPLECFAGAGVVE